MSDTRTRAPWLVLTLGAMCAGAIAAAVLVVGPASSSQATVRRTATVAAGVVQSTVSGSGNLAPISQLDLGFKTSGTVTHIYVHVGEQVAQGQLLAAVDPESAEVTLEQAKATLQAAEANLAKEEESGGESGSGASSGANSASAREGSEGSSAAGSTPARTGSGATTTVSAATRAANLASARAAVRSDKLTVQGAEAAVQDTKLYAPEGGTIVSLGGQVGEVVSASGTTKASSTSSSSSSTATGAGTGAAGSAARGASSSAGTSGSSSSSSAFMVLSNLSSMQLVVALSESEVVDVHDGQIATVTVEALEGRKLAAHVREVAILSTSSSGVVSYDVTFQLDQSAPGIRPGMSASAEVVVKQAEGLNIPTSAISASTVTVVRKGSDVRQRVVAGLSGNSSTIILAGLNAGETVLLPSATSSSSSSSTTSRRGALGGLGGAGGIGGGGAVFFRGGG